MDTVCPICQKQTAECGCAFGKTPLAHIMPGARQGLPTSGIKVASYERTCVAFPTQWEATTQDGLYLYIRFRQTFCVEIAESQKAWAEDSYMTLLYVTKLDEDPYMSDERMKELTSPVIDW